MVIQEQCHCGAVFRVKAEAGDALGAVVGWRATHRHEAVASVELEDAEDE